MESIDAVVRQVRRLAAEIAVAHGIADYADDLAQEALLQLLPELRDVRDGQEELDAGRAQQCLERLAARERQRRRRRAERAIGESVVDSESQHQRSARLVATPGKGVPRLCIQLVSIGVGSKHEDQIVRAIRAAAFMVAIKSSVLNAEQFHLFTLAYGHGESASEIADSSDPTERAVTRRLQRIVKRIQQALVVRLSEELPADARAEFVAEILPGLGKKKIAGSVTAASESTCELLLEALEAIADGSPGNRLS